ncbi:MAG: hypothetical protein B6I37_06005 [Desulfobacteraceae bacterium 4572_35.2]|nr:MAG: hypothetical protein B6I37_06005 [Desulfobacteraceae bacterium 4572_35.2]
MDKIPNTPLTKWRLFCLSCRCLFLQSSWNYKQFQGLGWCVALLPHLTHLYGKERVAQVLKGYLKYFNTNTFLAPTIAAATLSIETETCRGEPVTIDGQSYPDVVMAPVAAVGDGLFWGGIRPFLSVLAVCFAVYGYWWSPLFLIISFNIPAGIFRVVGVWLGYHQGASVVLLIQRWRLADIAVVLKRCTVVVAGGLCAVLTHQHQLEFMWSLVGSFVVIVTLFLTVICLRKGVPLTVVLIGMIAGVTAVNKLLL